MAFLPSSLSAKSPEQRFWAWFQKNEDRLFTFERDQEKTSDALATEMRKVDKSLTFEFGPVSNGKREFVISADGIRKAFPKVTSLHTAAPVFDRWVVIPFRPRRAPMDIDYGGIRVKAATFRVLIGKADRSSVIPLMMLFPSFDSEYEKVYRGIAFLLLDGALVGHLTGM